MKGSRWLVDESKERYNDLKVDKMEGMRVFKNIMKVELKKM